MRSLVPMTSAEFVAKYKLFKPIAERGARSFLAQEVQGHRAVLVHRLDIAPPDENRRILVGLESLRPEEKSSIIEVMDVDGVAVVVTRFTPDFQDLPSWVAQREQPSAPAQERPAVGGSSPGGFTSAFSGFGYADAPPPTPTGGRTTPAPGNSPPPFRSAPPPPPLPPQSPAQPQSSAGEFTQLFGKPLGQVPDPAASPPLAPQPVRPQMPPRGAGPSTPAPGELTQLFHGLGAGPTEPIRSEPMRQPAPPMPPPAASPRADSSWPPPPVVAGQPSSPPWTPQPPASPIPQPSPFAASPPPSSPPVPPSAPARGEFTQLFHGLGTSGMSPAGAPQFPPVPAPPPSSFGGPPLPPSFGAPGAPHSPLPGALPPLSAPRFGDAPPAMGAPSAPVFGDPSRNTPLPGPPPLAGSFGPPPPVGGSFGAPSPPALGPSMGSDSLFGSPASGPPPVPPTGPSMTAMPGMASPGSAAGASEFTRMLGAIQPPRSAPPPPAMPVAPVPPPAPAGAQQAGSGGSIKSYLPLILAVNVVLIAAMGVILYFALKP